jgi:hypothetical protein
VGGFHECLDGRRRRSEIRIARAEVDDVDAALEQLTLPRGNVRERVHREGLEAISQLGQFILRAVLKWARYGEVCIVVVSGALGGLGWATHRVTE